MLDDMNIKNVNKKTLKSEYQLLFKLVSKVLFPRFEKRTTVSGPDLFFMKVLLKYEKVNLPTIMIEHINTVITVKDGNHGLAYRFWLNRVFPYFNVECGKKKVDSVKQMFNITTLEDNEYIPRISGGKSKSIVSELVDMQKSLRNELDAMTALVDVN